MDFLNFLKLKPDNSMNTEAAAVPTKEARKEKIIFNEIGNSGTQKQNGFIFDDYNRDLQGQEAVRKYEEMRSSDATVAASLLAMELPIRATKWFVESGKTDGEITQSDEEIRDFVQKALFEKLEAGSFDDFLRQALTMLPFGFSVFEKVYKYEDGYIYIKKLAQRLQKSIYKWEMEDGGVGITQMLSGTDAKDTSVSIPREKLIIFSYRKEGDNYEGRSALRSAYKPWYMKDVLTKLDAVRHEKLSNGIPVITLPKGASTKDKEEAEEILANLSATEQTFVVLPDPDWKFEFANLNAGSTSDPKDSIAHHNREITKNVLAQFLELGASAGGSYSLSEDQSSLFLLSLSAVATGFSEVVFNDLIKELVDLNFNIKPGQTYPYLKYAKIGDVKYDELANVISTLSTSGFITPDEDLEDYFREVLDLPEKKEEEMAETPEEELTPDEEMASEDDVADLENELASLEASEKESLIEECIFNEISFEEALSFRVITQETKDKISQGLIDYWKRKGKKTTQEVTKDKQTATDNKQTAATKIKTTRDDFNSQISNIRDQIKGIKKGKATKGQIAALRKQIDTLKTQKNTQIEGLRSIREMEKLKINDARKELKARKAALKEFISKLTEKVNQDLLTEDEAKAKVDTQIKTNSKEIKQLSDSLGNQIKGLRDKLKGLSRSTAEYKSLRQQIDEKTNLKNENIKAIREENTTLRESKSQIIQNKKDIRADKKEVVAKVKKELFNETDTQQFADEAKVEMKTAKRILNILEEMTDEEAISVEDIGIIMRNLKSELRMSVGIAELLNNCTDQQIKKVIYDLIRRRGTPNDSLELVNYGFTDKEEVKDFIAAKKIFNFLDIINVQTNDK